MNFNSIPSLITGLIPDPQDPSDDDFSVVGGEILATFSPWASWLSVGNPFAPTPTTGLPAVAGGSADGQSDPASTVAVTSGGITINLIFDTAALAAPASFRAGIQQAVAILAATITDKITVNIKIDYSGTGGGAAAGPDHGLFESYSSIKADLINNATPGDTTFNALAAGSSIQGQSSVAVWNAQLKLWGLMAPNDTTTDDGGATFATDINPNELVGVALHELTHAMGRVPYGPQADIFDFFRFTSTGTRLFQGGATAPAAYFSLDGGNTKLADYGRTSDASDFLNSGVQGSNDPFNEFYNGATAQHLTAVDIKQLDALGFHLAVPDTQAPVVSIDNPLSVHAGGTQTITDGLLNASDNVSSGAQLHYTVTTGPAQGSLLLSGSATSSFTQADIDNGLVSYHQATGGTASDSFYFSVTDAAGNMSGITSFQINTVAGIDQAVIHDFNGDGKSDILWRSDAGTIATWDMDDGHTLSTNTVGSVPDNWKIAGIGDFNGDGKSDILSRTDSGTLATWDMNDNQILSTNMLGSAPDNWKIAGTGDFNGDGKSDILWRSDAGTVVTWDMNDSHVISTDTIGSSPANWQIAGTGDFNGDGKADILWRSDAGTIVSWDMNDNQALSTNTLGSAPANWKIAATGDFNGDGKSDLLWRSDAGTVVTWDMNDGQVLSTNTLGSVPADWMVAATGDFNGDNKTDILWRNDAGNLVTWDMNDGHILSINNIGLAPSDWHIV